MKIAAHLLAAAWRNGVFPFHHYHSNAHEALGVYEGEVTVQFGGDGGVTLTARPDDMIVLPVADPVHGPSGPLFQYWLL